VPEVTVVIPVWDAYVPVLAQALTSVLAQDVALDVLVIDNASETPLDRLPESVRLHRLPQRVSVGVARNVGLELATTEWVLFLDADDLLTPGTVRALLAPRADGDTVAVCGGVIAVNERTGVRLPLDFPSRRTRALGSVPALLALHNAVVDRLPTTGCLLIRVPAARDAGGFADGDFGEDWALNLGLTFRGRVLFVDHPGRLFRPHGASLRSRPRPRAEIDAVFAGVRRRIRTDQRASRLVRLSLPALRLLHARTVRRLCPGGVSGPSPVLRVIGDGRVLAADRTRADQLGTGVPR
jgi:GT2 family glycosyltransferase